MMLDIAKGPPDAELPDSLTLSGRRPADRLESRRPLRRVLLIPPDYTRPFGAGALTCRFYERLLRDAEPRW